MKRIGVIGAGQMGSGIAQVAAMSGYEVMVRDVSKQVLERGVSAIEKNLSRMVEKGKIKDDQKRQALLRIHTSLSIADLRDVDLVIEAATENLPIKLEIFRELDSTLRKGAILASNTSSISITKIAASTTRPEDVIGIHFMNPVPVMKLVEVIKGLRTSDTTYRAALDLIVSMNKTAITSQDSPGFIINRILCPMINEAIFALESGIASVEDIDQGMVLGTNQPMGPLTLADFIGLDTVLAIMEVLHREFGEDKFRPAPLLRRYVDAGLLGRKSGRGFYDYKDEGKKVWQA